MQEANVFVAYVDIDETAQLALVVVEVLAKVCVLRSDGRESLRHRVNRRFRGKKADLRRSCRWGGCSRLRSGRCHPSRDRGSMNRRAPF